MKPLIGYVVHFDQTLDKKVARICLEAVVSPFTLPHRHGG